MTPLRSLLREGPRALKHTLRFGGTGYNAGPFWLSDDKRALFSNWSPVGDKERIGSSFEDYVDQAYKANGVVFTCIMVRQMALAEARFQMQRLENGRPGELFDDPRLAILHRPAPNMTSGELISRLEQDASLAGNAFQTPVSGRLRRLRPDWVTIISGVPGDADASPFDLEAEVLGYIYHPQTRGGVKRPEPVLLTPDRVVHYSPVPDPLAQWRGMSWLTPVLNEIDGDNAAMRHKLKFFENGATTNLVLSYDASVGPEDFKTYVELFTQTHVGVDKAYKALHVGGGVDPKMLGTDLKQLDFKVVQGHGETRIAAASGVGAVIAQFSEGMQGSSLNSGNYGAAKRRVGDMTLRPLWRIMSGSLETIVKPGPNERLWYDDRDVEFLKEDRKDSAEIQQLQAQTIRALVDAGYVPESVVTAVEQTDFTKLAHSGLYSVQLQAPGGDTELTLSAKIEAVGALVRAGYDPAAALTAVGLDPITHLGLLPVTLQSTRQLELTPGEAAAVTPS